MPKRKTKTLSAYAKRSKSLAKPKPIKTKKADELFSKYIRERDGKCSRCGKVGRLTNSHYWSRIHSGTRYDPENCDSLCWLPCHYTWEHEKQGDYRDFKLKQLGQERYDELEKRARSNITREQAIKECLTLIEYEKNRRNEAVPKL